MIIFSPVPRYGTFQPSEEGFVTAGPEFSRVCTDLLLDTGANSLTCCEQCGSLLPLPCPHCDARMPEAYNFCGSCGRRLRVACAGCGAAMPSSFRFCGDCGLELSPSRGWSESADFIRDDSPVEASPGIPERPPIPHLFSGTTITVTRYPVTDAPDVARPDVDSPIEWFKPALPGNEMEWAAIGEAIISLQSGKGGLMVLQGAAGIGKTRLLQEVEERLTAGGVRYLTGAAPEQSHHTPLLLWRTWLLHTMDLDGSMSGAEAATAIRKRLADLEEALWADWLAAVAVEPPQLQALELKSREMLVRGALRTFLTHWQGGQPAILLVDDADQLDSFSLRLLQEVSAGETPPLLVLLAGCESDSFPPPGAAVISLSQTMEQDPATDLLGVPKLPCASVEAELHSLDGLLRAAEAAMSLAAYPEAWEMYEEVLSVSYGCEEFRAEAVAFGRLGDLAAYRGDVEEALERYSSAIEGAGIIGPEASALQAAAIRSMAELHQQQSDFAEADVLLRHALLLLYDCPEREAQREKARCLILKARVLNDLGRKEEGLQAGMQAFEMASAGGWNFEIAAASHTVGLIHSARGEWKSAEPFLRSAAELGETCGDWPNASASWFQLGKGLQTAGCTPDAITSLQRALEWADRLRDLELAAAIQLSLGNSHLNGGEWNAAETAFRMALENCRKQQDEPGVMIALCSLGDALRLSGRLAAAKTALREAGVALETSGDPTLKARLSLCRAELSNAMGDPRRARALALHAIEIAESMGVQGGCPGSHLCLGRSLRLLGSLTQASEALERASDDFIRAEEPLHAARARAELAAVLVLQGNREKAHPLLNEAIICIEQLDARPWLEHLPVVEG